MRRWPALLVLLLAGAGCGLGRPVLLRGSWAGAARARPLLVSVQADRSLAVLDVSARKVVDRPVVPVSAQHVVAHAWLSPSGRYLTVGLSSKARLVSDRVVLLDRQTRAVLLDRPVSSSLLTEINGAPPAPVVFSADEGLMIFDGEVKGRLYLGLYSVASFKRHAVLAGQRPAFSSDGKWLLLGGRQVHAIKRQGGAVAAPLVRKLRYKAGSPCNKSPVALGLALGRTYNKPHHRVVALDLATGEQRYQISQSTCPAAISADGRSMLFVSSDWPRQVWIHDARTGEHLWHRSVERDGSIWASAVSRDQAHVLMASGVLLRFTAGEAESLGSVGKRSRHSRGICFGHWPCGSTSVAPAFFVGGGRYLWAADSTDGPQGRAYLLR